jgi:hypothetical protein
VQVPNGRAYRYGNNFQGNGNGRGWNNNGAWNGNGRNYYGRNPGNQIRNDLARIYGGNYGYGRYPYVGGNRYGVGYRGYGGYGGYPYGRFGLGAAYGPYGYGYFPWYGGLGLYGGLAGLSRIFGNGIYGSGYYNSGYYGGYGDNGGTTIVYPQPEQVAPPVDDYVPQVNVTSAQLGTAASGNAVLGVTIDPEYPNAAVIRTVTPGSPAEVSGLRAGDMIASINERVIQSPNDVVNLIASMRPGDRVDIQFVRPIPRSEVTAAAPELQPGATTPLPATETVPPTPVAPLPDPAGY